MADHVDLQAALDDLSRHLAWPVSSTDVTARTVAELRNAPKPAPPPALVRSAGPAGRADRRLRRRALAAVAAAIAAVLVVSMVPSARQAVADLLGVGGVRITRADGPLRDVDGRLDLGRRVSLSQARRLAPGPLPQPAALGAPTAVFAGEPPGGITLVWAPDETLPEVLDFDVGLLITAFPGGLDGLSEGLIGKRTTAGGTVQLTDVSGEPAYWLAGEPHEFFYVDEHGQARQDTVRLSGSALVWEHDGVTYRLESALQRADAMHLAESVPQ